MEFSMWNGVQFELSLDSREPGRKKSHVEVVVTVCWKNCAITISPTPQRPLEVHKVAVELNGMDCIPLCWIGLTSHSY